ncbi:chemotaxis protein CheB [Salmonirosea aquatica]|uniref:PAS domain-containing protein n=1 Tax=Salmonirosea aquatica TaxID=2654236 RepID=A0A7C9F8J7_9BACT|nr:PAS domain-containing protein [Cytophagaceae bacterium SJW1-29]
MAAKKKAEPAPSAQNFPVVGIGASAGGLDAFKRFLRALPVDLGMAYVLVQHLNPDHESLLPEILAKETSLPVHEITDDIRLAPDHVYIIPENKILTATDGVLKLSPLDRAKRPNMPIDVFFASLAEVHSTFAVGVVLSGTGSDGTLGLKAIKEYGGITFAQDGESAAYGGMPQSALQAEVVDFTLSPEKIPGQLRKISQAYQAGYTELEEEERIPKDDEQVFKQILSLLRQRCGVDFTYYKQPTLRRRIARRMALSKKNTQLPTYFDFLRENRNEQEALCQDMLIAVTSFFRDPKTFHALTETVFPALFKSKSADEPIRIWIAGCSTGEEAYSIAMCLHEFLGSKAAGTKISIFASDLSERNIRKARAAVYSIDDVQAVSEAQLKTYFTRHTDGYEVSKVIRDMCVFAPHNFLTDPPFARMDLISCRNVLIYMDPFLQKKALTTFHYALRENGFLLLGKSETAGASSELFTLFTKQEKIYARKSVPGRFIHVTTERREEALAQKDHRAAKPSATQTDYRKSAEAVLLTKFTPASVVVNEQMDIVHIHSVVTPFLEPSPGKPTFNLLKMAREGLSFELRNALYKARQSEVPVRKDNIPIKVNGKESLVSIEIVPLTNTVEPHYLVLFQEKGMVPGQAAAQPGEAKAESTHLQERIAQLEKELSQAREDMRAITEDMEAVNEELQSTNEEMQSSNEEMQSLNEELETSKEELQSTNEELTVINQELLDNQQQLNDARLYAEAIVTTIRHPLVVLDHKLRIRNANESFYQKFNMAETDVEGQLFYEIQNHRWNQPELRDNLEKVLPKRQHMADLEIVLKSPELGERTLLLNARQIINEASEERLILLAMEDITERKTAEHKLKLFSEQLAAQVDELQQVNVRLGEFARAASHDLQEPLRKILLLSSRLQETDRHQLTQESQVYLDKIEEASHRMSRLISDLLDYSRLTHHARLLTPTDLNETLNTVVNDLELMIAEKNATITYENLPTLEAIPFQINQLFYNLIGNALKFSKEGVPSVITITSRVLSKLETADLHPPSPNKIGESPTFVEIRVKDNGIGFEQKYEEQVFTIFKRLHQVDLYGGSGIGLALCKKIVEFHQGKISALSKKNDGAEFRIILPLVQPKGRTKKVKK